MNFDKWAKGKNLKPFMCLVKILHGNFLARYDEEKTLDRLQSAFPYYDREDLLRLIREVVSHLRKPGKSDSELSKWYNYFYYHRYRDEIERVSSPVLYHFLQKEYLLISLENRFLYPTILSLDEYLSRPPGWIPDTLRPAELEKKLGMSHGDNQRWTLGNIEKQKPRLLASITTLVVVRFCRRLTVSPSCQSS